MTHPGPDDSQPVQPGQQPVQPGQQPAQPGQSPYPAGQQPGPVEGAPAQQSGTKKWVPIIAGVAVLAVLAVGALALFVGGDPKVNDCVSLPNATEAEVVDCDADEAQFRIVGVDEQEIDRAEFEAAGVEDICMDFAKTEVALWIGDEDDEPGTIYCAAAI